MIVSLPTTTLKDTVASKSNSCKVERHASKFFSQTPSIKQLLDNVLYQPSKLPRKRVSNIESKEESKPEDEYVITSVEQSEPTLDQKQIVKAIAGHLTCLLDDTVVMPEFEGKQVPSISIHDYVDRLIRYVDAWAGEKPSISSTGVSAALLGIEYLDRLNTGFSPKSIHRLYMCAVLVAVKFTEDFSISNRFWAKVAGIDLLDMNRMELAFCNLLNWKLQLSREEFECQQVRFAEPVF